MQRGGKRIGQASRAGLPSALHGSCSLLRVQEVRRKDPTKTVIRRNAQVGLGEMAYTKCQSEQIVRCANDMHVGQQEDGMECTDGLGIGLTRTDLDGRGMNCTQVQS